MAHVILGLLMLAPQSLYDLVKSFEAGVGLVYSASSGSIKRALDGLLANGLIEVESVQPGGRGRKVYRTTDAGRAAFQDWIDGPIEGPDLETAALSRLFFLGLLDPPGRAAVLERIRERAAANVAELEAVERHLAVLEVPEEFREVLAYQRATLDYGLSSGRHALAWFTERAAREASS